MKIKSLLTVPLFLLAGSLSVSAAEAVKKKVRVPNVVPVTSLTKSCKPMINKNLVIPKVPIRGLSERDSKRISRALEKLGEELYDESIVLFKKLLESTKNQHTKATVAKFIGVAYAQQNKSIEATKYFSQSLDLGKGFLQPKELQDLTLNVASMLYSNDKKAQSMKYLERWMKNSKVDSDIVYLLYSSLLYDTEKLKESICPAYWAAKISKKPNKNALGLLLASHFEFKDYKGSIALLKQLILDFPKEKRYWRNLASVYSSQDQLSDALAIMEMFYVQDMMETENDYKLLSSMFAYNDIPFRTAVVLKEGIEKGIVKDTEKNWKNIASNFHVASEMEKAIDAYAKSAAKSDTGGA